MKALLLVASLSTFAVCQKPLTIHVIESHWTEHGAISQSCNGDGSQQNCSMNPDISGHTVAMAVIMPDGSHATLACDSRRAISYLLQTNVQRACADLPQGDYPAEIKNSTAWLTVQVPTGNPKYAKDGTMLPRKMEARRFKYQIVAAGEK